MENKLIKVHIVSGLSGEKHSYEVHERDTVLQLKEKVAANIGKPVENVHLIFAGKQLQNNKKLKEEEISNDSNGSSDICLLIDLEFRDPSSSHCRRKSTRKTSKSTRQNTNQIPFQPRKRNCEL
jgi:hypothetical protein